MSSLAPVAFDIETTGLGPDATLTAAGLAFDAGAWLGLNTGGRRADAAHLEARIHRDADAAVVVAVRESEAGLLDALAGAATDRCDPDRQYLTAYNGETWDGGFDLPFLRRACARHHADWPFPAMAYADVRSMVARIATGDARDLETVYDALVGGDHGDPFDESAEAVAAHEAGEWAALLAHNLADVRRTRALAALAGEYVPQSDFGMKNLAPPDG